MTPADFRKCLHDMNWTQRGLARMLNRDERLVRRWAAGDAGIPPLVAQWLRRFADMIRADPPPRFTPAPDSRE